MNVAVIDHGMGNLRSVAKALEVAGATVAVTSSPDEAQRADAVCVPGQGIFGRCIDNMAATGLDQMVHAWIDSEKPYLGICLGMQILFSSSEEQGGRAGLGLFDGPVTRLTGRVTIPHMGWNEVAGDHYYFDHSYAVHPTDASMVKAWCEHGDVFAAWIEAGAVTAFQFHPEKSSKAGIALLEAWIRR